MSWVIIPTDPSLNYVLVNGMRSPGRATLTGVKVPYAWDIQESYGREGATATFKGRGIAKFTLTIAMWEREHFGVWPVFAALLEPPKPPRPPLVVEMHHPLLAAADIRAVSVESIGQPERQPNGLWIATINLFEYRPPKQALMKPRGSIPAVTKGKPIPPKTEADIALAAIGPNHVKVRARASGVVVSDAEARATFFSSPLGSGLGP